MPDPISARTVVTEKMTASQKADALEALARTVRRGFPIDSFYVADHGIILVGNVVSVARWRDVFGDYFEISPGLYVPLNVAEVVTSAVA